VELPELRPRVIEEDYPGMTHPSNWDSTLEQAFTPTKDNCELNELEGEAYLQYLKTRFVLTEYDNPPRFEHNYSLNNRVREAYGQKNIELTLAAYYNKVTPLHRQLAIVQRL
jgi:hypothetical protein